MADNENVQKTNHQPFDSEMGPGSKSGVQDPSACAAAGREGIESLRVRSPSHGRVAPAVRFAARDGATFAARGVPTGQSLACPE